MVDLDLADIPVHAPATPSARVGTRCLPRPIPVAEPTAVMWPSWLCGLQPIDAQDLALSRSGTPHNHLLTDSKRLGVAGARGVATTNIDAGVDRQIPAKSWANPRSRWLSQRPFRERRTRACYASIGPWNPMLMWRSAGVPFEGTGGCSGRRHITDLAT